MVARQWAVLLCAVLAPALARSACETKPGGERERASVCWTFFLSEKATEEGEAEHPLSYPMPRALGASGHKPGNPRAAGAGRCEGVCITRAREEWGWRRQAPSALRCGGGRRRRRHRSPRALVGSLPTNPPTVISPPRCSPAAFGTPSWEDRVQKISLNEGPTASPPPPAPPPAHKKTPPDKNPNQNQNRLPPHRPAPRSHHPERVDAPWSGSMRPFHRPSLPRRKSLAVCALCLA
jgi:hypothetical protein